MDQINYFIVFIEGILSIFSPCILPILPVYFSMLSNSSVEELCSTNVNRKTLLRNTILFCLGISTTFFLLGSATTAFSSFFNDHKALIMILGGIIILIMGLFYMGVIQSNVLSREKRIQVEYKSMSAASAFILGFTFSFGWTPCIGPILASVLVMASSSTTVTTSYLLILIYTLGFILPFILVSLFFGHLIQWLTGMKKHMGLIKRISGVCILIAGLVMFVNGISDYNKQMNVKNESSIQNTSNENEKDFSNVTEDAEMESQQSQEETNEKVAAIDFVITDQYGKEHTLRDYRGKTVFLNIWATWCPPCREEMPYIEELYQEYGRNENDVVILGVASPNLGREGSKEDVRQFLEDNKYTFPVVMDEEGRMVYGYGISAFPSTLIIDQDGYITQYIPGAMDKETMKSIIEGERKSK